MRRLGNGTSRTCRNPGDYAGFLSAGRTPLGTTMTLMGILNTSSTTRCLITAVVNGCVDRTRTVGSAGPALLFRLVGLKRLSYLGNEIPLEPCNAGLRVAQLASSVRMELGLLKMTDRHGPLPEGFFVHVTWGCEDHRPT